MKDGTKATHAGRRPKDYDGVVNPPVMHASTILYPTVEHMRSERTTRAGDSVTYGVHGTETTFALETAIRALEGGYRTRLQPSGLVACTLPLLAYASAGDHVLITDSVYGPTRAFCDGMLTRMGVEVEYYDPLIGGGIKQLLRKNTTVVWVESPGSWTFEVQDIPAIAEAAHTVGATVIMDNTWASPLYYKPFEHGVDVSTQAVTKYIAGHSDLVMGSVTCTEEAYDRFQRAQQETGICPSPDDVFLAMRGLRTIHVRLPHHMQAGLQVAEWLAGREEVAEVMHPALPTDPGHALWKRDFLGASSLFAFILKPEFSGPEGQAAMLDNMNLFGMGFSWGGFESLLIPIDPPKIRTATEWPRAGRAEGAVMRIHVGLEDVGDLIDDLDEGFARLRGA